MDFRVFASKVVHAKLVEAHLVDDGYPSLRTVARWTKSGKAPGWAELAMREIVGQQENSPPAWAEGLIADVPAIRADVARAVAEVVTLKVVLEAIQSGLLPPDDDPVDDPPPVRTRSRHDQ